MRVPLDNCHWITVITAITVFCWMACNEHLVFMLLGFAIDGWLHCLITYEFLKQKSFLEERALHLLLLLPSSSTKNPTFLPQNYFHFHLPPFSSLSAAAHGGCSSLVWEAARGCSGAGGRRGCCARRLRLHAGLCAVGRRSAGRLCAQVRCGSAAAEREAVARGLCCGEL